MTDESLAAIRERHANVTKLENEIPLTEYAGPKKSGRVQWELYAHTANVLCQLRNAVPGLLADIDFLLQAIDARDATIAEHNKWSELLSVSHRRALGSVTALFGEASVERDNLRSEVARLTRERDEVAAQGAKVERERIEAWLRERGLMLSRHPILPQPTVNAIVFEFEQAADAIAAGEGKGAGDG